MTDPDIVTELRAWGANGYMIRAADEIERLRAERDEARRMLCLEWTEHSPCFEWVEDRPVRLSKEQIAMRYGWDCFKENTDG